MSAFAAGNKTVFRELFLRYAHPLRRALVRDLYTLEEANDLVQQAFLQLYRRGLDFDPSRKLKPWLYAIALNLKRDYFRGNRRRDNNPLDEAEIASFPGSSFHDRLDAAHDLSTAMRTLPDAHREVIELHLMRRSPTIFLAVAGILVLLAAFCAVSCSSSTAPRQASGGATATGGGTQASSGAAAVLGGGQAGITSSGGQSISGSAGLANGGTGATAETVTPASDGGTAGDGSRGGAGGGTAGVATMLVQPIARPGGQYVLQFGDQWRQIRRCI